MENKTWENEGKNWDQRAGSREEVRSAVTSNTQRLFENRNACEWLSTKEAAHYLRLSENALRIQVHRDKIPALKFGSRLRFRLIDLEALFERKGA
jgi:excisionase family DNA binding protein